MSLYAGSEILDLLCGKLSDLDIWNRNGIKTAVAMDRDEAALEIAARRVSHRPSGCSVRLICADLGIAGVLLGKELQSFNVAFCHFGVHYFSDESMDAFLSNVNLFPVLGSNAHG